MKKLLLVVLLLLPSIAFGGYADWDKQTRDNFWRSTNWIALDWHSTDMLAADGWNGYRELNPILGPHPSQSDVALYFMARIGVNYWMHDRGWDNAAGWMSVGHAFAAAHNYDLTGNSDKTGHIIVGAIVGETVTQYTGSRLKGCAAALAVGLVKESFDDKFDARDASATAIGCSIIRIEF